MPARIQTFTDGKHIYSVDMMIAYLNTHRHKVTELPVARLETQLHEKVWGDWSPADVLTAPRDKRYAENAARIKKADLSYPVLVTAKGQIIDGYHRLAKVVAGGAQTIKAVIFNAAMMRKFILNSDMDFVKVHQHTSLFEILELWHKRFC
jgi:hypothetical protein